MSDDWSNTLKYDAVNRDVYRRGTLVDLLLVSAACVDYTGGDASISGEDQQRVSDDYHKAGDGVIGHAIAAPAVYWFDVEAPAKQVVSDRVGMVRNSLTEILKNAYAATRRAFREAEKAQTQPPSGMIEVLMRTVGDMYAVQVKNYGSQVPAETLQDLRRLKAEQESNGKGDGTINLLRHSARVANEKNAAYRNINEDEDDLSSMSGMHGGLGLAMTYLGLKDMGGSFGVKNVPGEDAVVAMVKFPYFALHPKHDDAVSPAPRPGMTTTHSVRSGNRSTEQLPGPLIVRDTRAFDKVLYNKAE